MGVIMTLPDVFEFVRWLDGTIPFFAVLPAFIGVIVLLRFFASEFRLDRPTPTQHDSEFRFDPDDFD
ncbi:hypothetical protein [Haladaptatus sp. NG-SE-30]